VNRCIDWNGTRYSPAWEVAGIFFEYRTVFVPGLVVSSDILHVAMQVARGCDIR